MEECTMMIGIDNLALKTGRAHQPQQPKTYRHQISNPGIAAAHHELRSTRKELLNPLLIAAVGDFHLGIRKGGALIQGGFSTGWLPAQHSLICTLWDLPVVLSRLRNCEIVDLWQVRQRIGSDHLHAAPVSMTLVTL